MRGGRRHKHGRRLGYSRAQDQRTSSDSQKIFLQKKKHMLDKHPRMRYLEYITDDELSGTQDKLGYEAEFLSFRRGNGQLDGKREDYQMYLQ